MAAQAKKTEGNVINILFFVKLLFTIFRESFTHLSKTTHIVIDDKEDGKRGLRVTYK